MRIDIYTDGDLGLWILKNVDLSHVGQIITTDIAVEALAKQRNCKVTRGSLPLKCLTTTTPFAFSVHYHRILSPEHLARYKKVYNLHPGFLPWGRGYFPVFWALWEQTPAGATLHEMTQVVDKGPIVAQVKIAYDNADTGWTLYQRVQEAERQLFQAYWARLIAGDTLSAVDQPEGGKYHSRAEFFDLKKNSPWHSLSGNDLIRLIRAFSFPKYSGLEISIGDKRFELRFTELGTAIL